MPLNAKGKTVLGAMKKQYGEKRGKAVFYASVNKGRISNVERHNATRAIRKDHAKKLGRY